MMMSDEHLPRRDDVAPEPAVTPATEIDAIASERDRFKDLLLRSTAEFDNYRRRIERERRETIEQASADLIKDLLPLLDDLERAARSEAGDHVEAYRQGVVLIGKALADVLAARGLTPIDPLGAAFDPHQHEAIARVPRDGAREGEVVEVVARGYKLKDRLLRPAVVKVAV